MSDEERPAAWHPDPTGRHKHRYWDGKEWTDQVASEGKQSTDPLGAAATPPAATAAASTEAPTRVFGSNKPTGPTPWWRRWWAIAVAVLLIAGVAGAIGGGSDDKGGDVSSSTDDTSDSDSDSGPAIAPAPTSPPTPPTTAAPALPSFSGDGVFAVGGDVQPGTYVSEDNSVCYWARNRDASGSFDSIIENDNASGQAIVQLNAGEIFETTRCSDWVAFLGGTPLTTFGDGTWAVPGQVAPGRWQSTGDGGSCYWERKRDFNGGVDSINANSNVEGPTIVDVIAGDAGFKSVRCGTWTRIG